MFLSSYTEHHQVRWELGVREFGHANLRVQSSGNGTRSDGPPERSRHFPRPADAMPALPPLFRSLQLRAPAKVPLEPICRMGGVMRVGLRPSKSAPARSPPCERARPRHRGPKWECASTPLSSVRTATHRIRCARSRPNFPNSVYSRPSKTTLRRRIACLPGHQIRALPALMRITPNWRGRFYGVECGRREGLCDEEGMHGDAASVLRNSGVHCTGEW
ncbi:hypothetical protein FB451DRAFT_1568067 [Mycena latifolia]|nr:hypothetical protein FB451DRAFT_1568067 [Mycena latifolia]